MLHAVLPFPAVSLYILDRGKRRVAWVLTQAEGLDEKEKRHAELLADHRHNGSSGIMSLQRLQVNNL